MNCALHESLRLVLEEALEARDEKLTSAEYEDCLLYTSDAADE